MYEIPEKAKKLYDEAVRIITEDLAQRRAIRGTDIVIENLREAIQEYEPYFEAWRLLGEIYLGTEESLAGYRALKRAYDMDEDEIGVITLLGEAALILDRPLLALKYLEEAHKAEKVPLGARKLMAIALSKAEKWDDALRAFGEALAEDPSDGAMRRSCTEMLSKLDHRPEAASVLADYLDPFRDFIDKQPLILNTGWIMKPGLVLDRLSKGAAERSLKNETTARAEDYIAWCGLGNVFLDGGKYDAAVACYKRALRVHPDYYDALHNMGIALEELGRPEDALQMYEAAVETDPDSPEAYLSIAELLEDINPDDPDEIAVNYLMYYRIDPEADGFEEMEEALSKRLNAAPDIVQILLLSQVYLLREEIEKADTVIRLMEGAGGSEATFHWIKGQIFQAQGNSADAEKAYRRGLEVIYMDGAEPTMEDDNPEAKLRYDLANLLEQGGKSDEALKILEEADDTLDADGFSLLADLLLKEHPEKADAAWERALNIDPDHIDTLLGLAGRMIGTDRIPEGIVLLERALKGDPENEEIAGKLRELYPVIGAPELSPPEVTAEIPE